MIQKYRTLFVGELRQDSFMSIGGTDDITAPVDSPLCRDGQGRPTLRGTTLAGALIATLRRIQNGRGKEVPDSISGSDKGRQPSVWYFFNAHQAAECKPDYRQHVAIDARTGAAADSALFNLETLPPGTTWLFMLEIDTYRGIEPAELAREALGHWLAGRCLLGREVARGMGWLQLTHLHEYELTSEHLGAWPCSYQTHRYPAYIKETFASLANPVKPTQKPLPGWLEFSARIAAGERDDDFGQGYGIDSVSIGGHASDDLATVWDNTLFLDPNGLNVAQAKGHDGEAKFFDPDASVVMLENEQKRLPYIPGSSLRGPLRHALARLLHRRDTSADRVEQLFGTIDNSAKLLISDAMPVAKPKIQMAWLQHHAEDEFAGGAHASAKFDRIAVMQGHFSWRMVLEDASDGEQEAIQEVFQLAQFGHIGIGGGQWRGHGWPRWTIDGLDALETV